MAPSDFIEHGPSEAICREQGKNLVDYVNGFLICEILTFASPIECMSPQRACAYKSAMPNLTQLALFFAAAFVLAIMPGPGIFYVAARTLAGGRPEGMASTVGTGLGGLVHVVAGALGVSAIVLASAELFTALKLLGAAYLVWIGFRTFQAARRETAAALLGETITLSVGPRRAFREGVLVEATNPKTAAFFLALIPQFVDLSRGEVTLQFIVFGCVSVGLNTLVDAAVVLGASRIRQSATARPNLIRRLREVSGGAMIAIGISLAFARRAVS